ACEVLDPSEACRRSPVLRRKGLRGALFSGHEVSVDARRTLAALPEWLNRSLGVKFAFGVEVTHCDPPWLASGYSSWKADAIWLCTGGELRTLFPETLQDQHLVPCKLQMMRSRPVHFRIGPMLAGGLTLRHYRAFERCPTLPALRARLAANFGA